MKRIAQAVLFSLFFSFFLFGSASCGKKHKEIKPIRYIGSYNRDFNDLNEVHLKEAKQIGINPFASRESENAFEDEMEKIESNKNYEVEKLTHSIPYLVPEAAQLLNDIGQNFRDSLENFNAPDYRIKVTSVTRTINDVKKLRRRNTNSSLNSPHQYGTTFDVSWVRYKKTDEKDTFGLDNARLKMVLAMVLRDMKKEKRCYVKHERKQGCFHITVRKNKN